MFKLIRKTLLLWVVLSCNSLSLQSQNWNFVDGQAVDGAAKKNLGGHNVDRLPRSEHGASEGDKAVLPAGDSLTALQLFQNLEPGFYDVYATVSTSSLGGVCYLFGKGHGYTMGSTLVPVGNDVRVVVRGVGTTDGQILAGVFSDGSQNVQLTDLQVNPSQQSHFLQGGDITELNYVLDYGGRYADENGISLCPDGLSREEMAQNVINYLSANGMNFVRIRLSNNPGQPDNSNTYYIPEGYQDESDCLQLAKMADNAGMDIQFTFNWSDFWSNGEQQDVPADWQLAVDKAGAGNEVATLADCAYNYTKKVMQNLAAMDIFPAYVSLGNETNGGFLFPYAYAYDVSADNATSAMPQGDKNWWAIAQLVNAGYKAVKEVSPASQVVIHLADNTYDVVDKADHVDWWVYSWYFDELLKAGGNFDVIGASYYPSWSTATAAQAADFYTQLIGRYNKDVLVMETGYNWTEKRKDGFDGQLPYTAPDYKTRFPFSKDGQKGFIADVLNELKKTDGGNGHRVVGDLYWDPIMIHVEDQWGNNATGWADWWQWKTPDANVVENTTLFDFSGQALPAFDAYRFNRNSVPLKAHGISAESTNGIATSVNDKAYFGDSISISWTATDTLTVDSVVVSFAGNSTTYKVGEGHGNRLAIEMPDGDVHLHVYGSQTSRTRAVVLGQADGCEVLEWQGGVALRASANMEVPVFAANGQKVAAVSLKAGEVQTVSLSGGVYLVGNRKVIVK